MANNTLAMAALRFLVSCSLQAGVSAVITAVFRRRRRARNAAQKLQPASKPALDHAAQAKLDAWKALYAPSAAPKPMAALASPPLPHLPEAIVDQIMCPVADDLFKKGDLALCMHLLRRGLISNLDKNLLQACQHGLLQPVQMLLARGAQPNDRHILAAFAGGKQEVVELVGKEGVLYDRETARTMCLRFKHYSLLRLLPGKGLGAEGMEFLRLEDWEKKVDLLEELLQNHISACSGNKLYWAACSNLPNTVGALLRHGANPREVGNSALKYSAQSGYRRVVKLLLQHGAVADGEVLRTAPAHMLPLLLGG